MFRKFIISSLLFLSLILIEKGYAEVSIDLNITPRRGTEYDTFQFTISVTGSRDGAVPHLEGGEAFSLDYSGSSSNIQIINGQTSVRANYIYNLTPKKTGQLQTPKVKLSTNGRDYEAAPLTIEVTKGTPKKREANSEVFLKRKLSKETVYEGEQLVATLQLYSQFRVEQGSFEEINYDGFWKEPLGKPTVREARSNGNRFSLHEVNHAIYPLESGELTVPPATLRVVIRKPRSAGSSRFSRFNLFDPDFFRMDAMEKITVRSDSSTISVKPLPSPQRSLTEGLSHSHIPVGDLSISLGYDTKAITTGDGKTLIVTLKSNGNIRPISELSLNLPEWIKSYSDKPEEETRIENGKFVLEKTFRLSLVPERSGTVSLPPIQILTFNPDSERYEVKKSRAIEFSVTPSEEERSGANESSPSFIDQNEEGIRSSEAREIYRYSEETLLEKLSRSISLSLALLLLAISILLVGSLYFGFKILEGSKKRKKRKELSYQGTQSISALREKFLSDIAEIINENGALLYGDALESKLSEHLSDPNTAGSVIRFIDKLNALSYGGSETDQDMVNTLAEEATILYRDCSFS